jgi:o-succinylbenzoate---CoA ligase
VRLVNSLRPVSGGTPEVVDALRDWLALMAEPVPLVVETSGSTGSPKRVELARHAVLASVHASARRLGVSGQWLLALPAAYVAGVQVICRSLVAGHPPVEVHGSFADTLDGLPHHRDVPVFTSLVPTQLHRLLADEREVAALRRLHTILLGGGPIDPALRCRAEEAGLHVVATYGASETAGGCVYDGLPLDGVEVAIDADGRVRIGGPTLFEGYADDPELTASTLVDGWYLTADAGRIDEDGRLRVLGRLDDVVVSGGVNVPLPAVARRLREHPAVETVEVLGVEDDEWGHRVVAFVVGAVVLEEVRDWVGEAHPRTWAPRQVVALDALPLLGNGKVDRQSLVSLAEEGA